MNPAQPYNQLPLLPPSQELETKKVLKACVEARAALNGLKEAVRQLPNPAVLINTMPFLEAQASSEIENIVTTTDALFKHAGNNGDYADAATKEALRYRTALKQGYDSLKERPISAATAIRICQTIKNSDIGIRAVPGVALGNDKTGEIIYTPPTGQALITDKLSNWAEFVHAEDDLDPIVRMAVAHYQFEAIHPFTDGNGRTGRVLNLLMLIESGLLEIPILYLSGYIMRNKESYYRLLLEVTTEQNWEGWILYMLQGVHETAAWTTEKIHAIRKLMKHTRDYFRAELPQIYSRELADLIFTQPYCRIQYVIEEGLAKRQTASLYLQQLVEIGVLNELKMGREKLFVHPKFLNLLYQADNGFSEYS